MVKYLKTSQIAKLAGVHPNTVRLYEARGYLSPVPRAKNGYRKFTAAHLEQVRLAHLALNEPLPGIYPLMIDLVKAAAAGNWDAAMRHADAYLARIRGEQSRAEAALAFLESWARGQPLVETSQALNIGQAARYLDVTADQLRNWDRSGLLVVPRDPRTGYRVYRAPEIGRLLVIRVLRQSGYSLMAILRMLRRFDAGETENLRATLDTPGEAEAIETVADRWLTTLARHEQRAREISRQLAAMMDSPR